MPAPGSLLAGRLAQRSGAVRARLRPTLPSGSGVDRALARALDRAGMATPVTSVARLRVALLALPAAGLLVAPLVAAVLAAVVAAAAVTPGPRLAVAALDGRARRRRDTSLPAALDRLAASLRAGATITGALRDVAAASDGVLGDELRSVVATIDAGIPVAAALDRWRAVAASSAVDLAATALVVAAGTGGPVARSVDRVAASLRERLETASEAAALATQARASAAFLAAAPLAFAGLLALADPRAAAFLVSTAPGLACLATGLVLLVLGGLWMRRIVAAGA